MQQNMILTVNNKYLLFFRNKNLKILKIIFFGRITQDLKQRNLFYILIDLKATIINIVNAVKTKTKILF